MNKVSLQRPSSKDQAAVEEIIAEFNANQETKHGFITPQGQDDFNAWLAWTLIEEDESQLPEGWVAGTSFLVVDADRERIVGFVNIRHHLNEKLERYGGHIGYSIRPDERNKGYGTAALALALEFCRGLGIQKALVTCAKDNIGSKKVILHNGGVFSDEYFDEEYQVIEQHYWITI